MATEQPKPAKVWWDTGNVPPAVRRQYEARQRDTRPPVPKGTPYIRGIDVNLHHAPASPDDVVRLNLGQAMQAEVAMAYRYHQAVLAGTIRHRFVGLPYDVKRYEQLLFPDEPQYQAYRSNAGQRMADAFLAGFVGTREATIAEYGRVYAQVRQLVPGHDLPRLVQQAIRLARVARYQHPTALRLMLEQWLACGMTDYQVDHHSQVATTRPHPTHPGYRVTTDDAYTFYEERGACPRSWWQRLLERMQA